MLYKATLKTKQSLPIKRLEKEIKMKRLFLSLFVGLSSVGAAAEDCGKIPLNEEKHLRIEEGRCFLNQEQFEGSLSVFQDLAQDTQIQQRKDFLFAVLFNLATNYDCMFVQGLGTIEQQGENINNAIGSYGQIIREIGALHGHERILGMAKASLERAQREKVEFELNHPESK